MKVKRTACRADCKSMRSEKIVAELTEPWPAMYNRSFSSLNIHGKKIWTQKGMYEKMFRTIHSVLSGGQHLLIVLTDGIQNKENRTGHRAAESITPGTRRTPTLKMNCNAILHFLATLPRGLRGRCIATITEWKKFFREH